jgi:hypothetical protein
MSHHVIMPSIRSQNIFRRWRCEKEESDVEVPILHLSPAIVS